MGRRDGRRPRRRNERGGALVEAAIVVPLLLLVCLGIVDFATIQSNRAALDQGVRDSTRSGIVASFGTTTSCPRTGSTATGAAINLVCQTKDRIGLNRTKTRVWVAAPAPYAIGSLVVVCAEYPIDPVTPAIRRFVTHDVLRSKAVMRVEQLPAVALVTGGETALSGGWSWCTTAGNDDDGDGHDDDDD